eukprot:CAMPEP_0172832586 /NCGR_PEP_ID=MMETSP1075-20121228/23768_1 /TAXON_ID=2916 /ORGANISM="Ceratium fusus, Strain PA161109" /LENGTH=275 /DNA_ID=CAMNT_0013675219 /DNA_START=28 /DNA_END=855 /DNA_ORIENTATION=-
MASPSSIALFLSFIVMFAINGLSQSKGPGFAKDNAEISLLSPTYLTPDGITFAIWPVIYLLELVATVQQVCMKDEDSSSAGWRGFLSLAYLLNATWLFAFSSEWYSTSSAIIVCYLVCLAMTYKNLDFTPGKGSPFALKAGVTVNLAWVCIATCINILISQARASTGTPPGEALAETAGTQPIAIACAVLVQVLAFLALYFRCDAGFATAVAWALFGVGRNQFAAGATLIASAAYGLSAICALGAVVGFYAYFQAKKADAAEPWGNYVSLAANAR